MWERIGQELWARCLFTELVSKHRCQNHDNTAPAQNHCSVLFVFPIKWCEVFGQRMAVLAAIRSRLSYLYCCFNAFTHAEARFVCSGIHALLPESDLQPSAAPSCSPTLSMARPALNSETKRVWGNTNLLRKASIADTMTACLYVYSFQPEPNSLLIQLWKPQSHRPYAKV